LLFFPLINVFIFRINALVDSEVQLFYFFLKTIIHLIWVKLHLWPHVARQVCRRQGKNMSLLSSNAADQLNLKPQCCSCSSSHWQGLVLIRTSTFTHTVNFCLLCSCTVFRAN
jgi:hypothetical protein